MSKVPVKVTVTCVNKPSRRASKSALLLMWKFKSSKKEVIK